MEATSQYRKATATVAVRLTESAVVHVSALDDMANFRAETLRKAENLRHRTVPCRHLWAKKSRQFEIIPHSNALRAHVRRTWSTLGGHPCTRISLCIHQVCNSTPHCAALIHCVLLQCSIGAHSTAMCT